MFTKKKVYIAYTGGTIGMKEDCDGNLVPVPGFLEEQMANMPELKDPSMPDYIINQYDPLLDSSNMTPDDWVKIAQDIKDNYEKYDAFIVLHGTDTMAFSASALSFMLENLDKTVIVSGSQIPLAKPRDDARLQLITILQICQDMVIPEVTILFGNTLLRGNRSTKAHADRFLAYESPNYPLLGQVGIDIRVNWDLIRPVPSSNASGCRLLTIGDNIRIASLRLFPGIKSDFLASVLVDPLKGLVLETFGTGNAPSDQGFLDVLKQANDRGVVIVNVTQCFSGTVNQEAYETGSGLAAAGVISGFDMTCEAALTKLFVLLTQYPGDQTQVKEKMQENLRGELTPDAGSRKFLSRYLPV
jgi:L-asparaginase